MPVPEPVHIVFEHPQTKQHLCYIGQEGVRHALVWFDDERWVTACQIQLGWGGSRTGRFIPGRIVTSVDLRDVVMGVPTCMLCIDAEDGRPVKHG
jgi:hypothetical protein